MIVGRGQMPTKGALIFAVVGWTVIAAVMIGVGVFLLVQRQTGPRTMVTVDDCVTTGAGRYQTTHCTGSWVVGGSLLDGGHVVVGTVDGAEQSDMGKTLEVTLRGDTAYTRGLALPLILLGSGVVAAALVPLLFVALRR
jgi:hypothetical protein